jgi:hypothetical protein
VGKIGGGISHFISRNLCQKLDSGIFLCEYGHFELTFKIDNQILCNLSSNELKRIFQAW